MKSGILLDLVLAKRLPIASGIYSYLSFDLLTFTNTSPRYVINPVTGSVTGPFGSGVPAIITVSGKRYLSVWRSLTNLEPDGTTLATWGEAGVLSTVAGGSPISTDCIRMTTTDPATNTGSQRFRTFAGRPSAERIAVSFFCKLGTAGSVASYYKAGSPNYQNISPAAAWNRYTASRNISGTTIYAGVYNAADFNYLLGAAGDNFLYWCCQVEESRYYAGRPIPTSGAAVTTNKDKAHYPAAIVPTDLRDGCGGDIYPGYSSAELATCAAHTKKYIARFCDSGANSVGFYLYSDDLKLHVEVDGTDIAATDALTWSAHQRCRWEWRRISGTLIASLFTAGNGTVSGTPPARSDGHLILGAYDTGDLATMNQQFDGAICELEICSPF